MKNNEDFHELSYKEVVEKYPDVSPFVILKADIQRRTVTYTPEAVEAAARGGYQLQSRGIFTSIGRDGDFFPVSLMLRDGSSVFTSPVRTPREPYAADVVDGKKVIMDGGEIVDEVDFWYMPDYMGKTTSSGRPMWQVASARPQRMDIDPYSYCHFWDDGKGCRYCNMSSHFKKDALPARIDAQDVYETVREALKQDGRFCYIKLTAGSILSGEELFDDEVNMYIEILQAIGKNFRTRKFPSQMISSAFSLSQLERVYEQTGLMSYTSDIEVLNEEKFAWICPGKQLKVGYREWKKRIFDAVGIFGKGFVNSGIVGGVELAGPGGFGSEDEALRATLEEAEDFAVHGVSVVHCVWVPYPGSVFYGQRTPSLEYFVRLSKGLHDLRVRYDLDTDMDDYRRCGNHPDTDLARVFT
ncbi:MAG: hypothetical protein LBU13_09040 [Synergistaceae bacterium]|jgi:hypothetical protein|nr:hypothetical protein [Synergistaceae bacterium]